jgi:acyl-CoA reductase-like NAD-dependent aldehyde dehydrogenase
VVPPEAVVLAHKDSRLVYTPYGVVLAITPWNYPFVIALTSAATALAAGNTVVLKPAPSTALIGLLIGELAAQAGFPPGVLNVVNVEDAVAATLVEDPRVCKIVFTGSVPTGRRIMAAAARNLTPVVLELGGKDAAIVMADCDLERTAQGVLWGAMTNSGQNCAAIERVYVEDAIYDRFLARLVSLAAAVAVAPVASPAQDATVRRHLADAGARGATLHGEYPGPVIVTDVPEDALVMTEETFGPVCPVIRVANADEGLRRANASRFGLTTSLWTRSEPRAERLAALADSGVVTVNNVALTASMPFAPWAGRKDSGRGVTNSHLALLEFVQPKFVLHDESTAPEVWWYPLSDAALAVARTSLSWLSSTGLTKLRRTFSVVGVMRRRAHQQKRAFRS